VLLVRGLSDGDQEFTGFIPDCPVNTKHIPLVAVAPLIERAHETDSGLDGETTRPDHVTSSERDFALAIDFLSPYLLLR